jgi:hypothetical protein
MLCSSDICYASPFKEKLMQANPTPAESTSMFNETELASRWKISVRTLQDWKALTRFLQDGQLPVDNNWIENQIRPIAIGRNNWLFAGSLRAGQRAAAVMSLIQSAKLNGHDPHAYLKDVLTRLPTHMNSRLDELLPHRWTPV